MRGQHEGKQGLELVPLAQARANALKTDWTEYVPPRPEVIGTRMLKNYDLAEIAEHIDWGPFFQAWELSGPFPAILEDPVVGKAARTIYDEGRAMLKKIIAGRWLTASAVFGLFPAASVDADDIEIYAEESRARKLMTWHNLRQQNVKPTGRPNLCFADFVAPKGSGVADYAGAFAVTAGIGIEKKLAEFEKKRDDYNAIMLKALADRLAEAFTELLHKRVRREFWGYARDERLDNDGAHRREIPRHPPGAGVSRVPRSHRESGAVRAAPGRAHRHAAHRVLRDVAGGGSERLLPGPPASQYFAVGKVGRDQIEDYARRKGMPVTEVERWLAPNLGYEPGKS